MHQMTSIYIFYSSVSTDEMFHTTRLTTSKSKVHHYYRHLPIWVWFFIFLGLSVIQSQLPDCSTDCVPLLVNHLFLVLPILQVITSPSRQQQMFSPWLSSSEPVGHVALQILRHVEIHVLPLVKHQEIVVSTWYWKVQWLSIKREPTCKNYLEWLKCWQGIYLRF